MSSRCVADALTDRSPFGGSCCRHPERHADLHQRALAVACRRCETAVSLVACARRIGACGDESDQTRTQLAALSTVAC